MMKMTMTEKYRLLLAFERKYYGETMFSDEQLYTEVQPTVDV